MGIYNVTINQAVANRTLKGSTLKNKIANFMLYRDEENTKTDTDFKIESFDDIANYYTRNSYENCHDDLKPVLNRLNNSVFGRNMFTFKESYAQLPGKDSSKTFCMLNLAHIVSKFTNNSKDYPQDSIEEIKYVLEELGKKAEEIKNISGAAMKPYIDSVKSVFYADLIVSNGNYYTAEQVKNTWAFVKTFFDNPQSLGEKDVDKKMYENRDIRPGDVSEGDIAVKYNEFLKKIDTNMFGTNGRNTEGVALYLANLIKLKDQQDRKEAEQFNSKIPYEDFFGRQQIFDPSDPEHPWNRGGK